MNKAEFIRSWGLPAGFRWHHLRWKMPPEKGVYWYFFSKKIRERDLKAWGTCISCGRAVEDGDCGHFIPASTCGIDLLFDERNCNLECPRCNAWDEGHLFGYERGLDKRYGEGTAQGLKERYLKYRNSRSRPDWRRERYVALLSGMGITKSLM